MLNVLFLDSSNTSHSLIAEAILRASTRGRFQAHSATCASTGVVSARLLAFLRERNLPVEGLRSKGLREMPGPFGFVIALSELAAATAAERGFPGDPVIAHWRLDVDDDAEPSVWALRDSYWILSRRIKIFTSLPHGKASRRSLENRLHAE